MSPALRSDLFSEGLAAYRQGRLADAERCLREHVLRSPEEPEGRHVLALVRSALGDDHEAEALLASVLRSRPSDGQAWSNFGDVLRRLGRTHEALQAHLRAVQLDPGRAESHNNLGTVYFDLEMYAEAAEAFERAVAIKPDYSDALANMTQPLIETGRFARARHSARTAVALDPASGRARTCLGLTLVYSGQVEAGVREFRRAVDLDPGSDRAWGNLLLRAHASSAHSAEQATAWAREWGSRRPGAPPSRPAETIRRVGLVSGDFRNHPVGRFVLPFLAHHSGRFEVYCYSNASRHDRVTAEIRASRIHWRDISQWPTEDAARLIESDGIDLLVDLAGHTALNRLDVFARRAAPVQATWMGFPGTTGLPSMDFALVDTVLAPAGDERLYTERLVRLEGCFLPLPGTERQAGQGPPPRTGRGHVRFGSFNNPAKFSEAVYALWAETLRAVPGSLMVFKYRLFGDPEVRRSVTDQMARRGIGRDRLEFIGPTDRDGHLAAIRSIDVALDTYPYSGATTTFDCLAAGVPVVTLAGDRNASRMSASLLTGLGERGLIADSPERFIETVAAMVESPAVLNETRARLTRVLGQCRLTDPSWFVPDIESALASMART